MRISIGLLAVLVCATGAWAVTDDFNDNSPSAGWTTGPNFTEQNARLEFIHGSTGGESEFWTWGTQMSYTSNWSVALDMTTTIDPSVLSGEQFAEMGLSVSNSSDGADAFRFHLAAGSEDDSPDPDFKFRELWSMPNTNNVGFDADESFVDLGDGNDSASLLISYSAATHTLSAQYDLDGNGFQALGSFDVVNGTANIGGWGMSGGDTFNLSISAWSEGLVMSSGLMYADNFDIVPEPATMGLLALGGIAMLRHRKK